MSKSYSKYVNKIVRTGWVKDWTKEFLSELDKLSGQDSIKSFCSQKKQELIDESKQRSEKRAKQQNQELTETSWMNSVATNMSQIRNAIKSWQESITLDENNSYPQQTKDGVVNQHLALLVMNFQSNFHKERTKPTEERKQSQRRNLVSISDVNGYQAIIEKLLDSKGWREVAVGLIAATGRRASEILKTAEFDQIGQFEINFSGQLKAKGEEREAYSTFTLIESNKVCDALLRLRRMPEIKELKKKTLAEIDSGRNSTVNKIVVETFSPIIEPPTGEERLSTKNLRASYAAIAIYLFCPWKQEPSQFIRERLGHTSDATASNYQDYQITDINGKPLTRGAWVERLGETINELTQEQTISRVRMTRRTKAVIDNQEFLLFPDQLSRMEELVRLAEIGKQFEEGNLVKEVVKTVTVEVPVDKELREDRERQSNVQKSRKSQKDVVTMSNEELMGAKIPGSGHEKIRRAVAAIKAHNESLGGNKNDMWAINIRTLKDLTNCRTAVVENYLKSDEGIEELGIRFEQDDNGKLKPIIGYNEMQGFGFHHNRGRGAITEVIKL